MTALASWLSSSGPGTAIEIAPEAVAVAVLGSRGSDPVVEAYGAARLPPGAVAPSLTGRNVVDPAAVGEALRSACERAGHRPRRAALVIPDLAARLSLLRFDQIPARREDLDQLVRWQVKKSSPFPIEDACVTHAPGVRTGEGGELIVVSARRETIREYESVCEAAGIHPGLVDLSTVSLVNLYLAGGEARSGDWLVVHVRPEYTSIAILRDGNLIFFRSRAEDDEDALADVVHQTAMYYQDRLGGQGLTRVFAGGWSRTGDAVALVRRELESRLGNVVEPIDPERAAAFGDRVAAAPDQAVALGPLVGMLLRARREAVAA